MPCIDINVRIYESSRLRIIIPAVQIIQPRLSVIAVTAIQIRVPIDQGRSGGVPGLICRRHLSPSIITVAHHQFTSVAFINAGDVALEVLAVDKQGVRRSGVHAEADRGACRVVVKPESIVPVCLKDDLRSFQNVIRCGSVYCLGSPDPVRIIGIADAVRAVVRSCQLAAALPGEGVAVMVLQRIADRIIADGVAVVGSQFILPVAVPVNIVSDSRSRAGEFFSGLVGVLLDGIQVPAPVVTVGDGLIEIFIVLPCQLVQVVVIVFQFLNGPLLDRHDVSQGVISIVGREGVGRGSVLVFHDLRLGFGHHARRVRAGPGTEGVGGGQAGAGRQGDGVACPVKAVIIIIYDKAAAVDVQFFQKALAAVVIVSVGKNGFDCTALRSGITAAGQFPLAVIAVLMGLAVTGSLGGQPAALIVTKAFVGSRLHVFFQTDDRGTVPLSRKSVKENRPQ